MAARPPKIDFPRLSPADRQAHLDRALAWTAAGMQKMFETLKDWSESSIESPLEEAFYLWWEVFRFHGAQEIYALPQVNVTAQGRQYRLDFQIYVGGIVGDLARIHAIEQSRIAVELDGYEFHERTPEQVAARNQRDRDLQMDDWTVFHFSGSEFHRNPAACIMTVQDFAVQAFFDLRSEVYKRLDK